MTSSTGDMPPGSNRGDISLEVRRLSKTYAGGPALRDVSFGLERAKVHALLGGNGSGKSTLIKCLAGVTPADSGGEIVVGGESIDADKVTPAWSRHHGLRFVHQHSTTFGTMTVEENLALGHGYPTVVGFVRWRALRTKTKDLLDRFGITAKPDQPMSSVRPADQAMIAVARALQDRYETEASAISTLVLDEPTAAMPEEEVDVLLEAIKSCARDGVAIVFVTHRLDEVRAIADTVTVLRDGLLAASQPAGELTQSDLVELILGEEFGELARQKRTRTPGSVVARLRSVTAGPLRDVSLDVREGEVLGIAGLTGSGRSELLRTIFGDMRTDGGQVEVLGTNLENATPGAAIARGVAYVPEERSAAVFPSLSVRENLSAPSVSRYARGPLLDRAKERSDSDDVVEKYSIKAPSSEAAISTLSGGNQQKVVLARWLERKPAILLLDEPTQGVDVGARADVFALIREAANDGLAVVIVSSDFEELADMSDRVLVLNNGRLVTELTGKDINRRAINEEVLMGSGVSS